MRTLLLAAACLAGACAARSQPYRSSMPMLGGADVPRVALRAPHSDPERVAGGTPSNREPGGKPRTRYAYGWQQDAQAGIRTSSAKGIELSLPEASAESAAEVTKGVVVWSRLPAPNKPPASGVASAVELPALSRIREPGQLRTLVGMRDKRESFAVAMGWLTDLGVTFVDPGSTVEMARDMLAVPTDGPALVAWAQSHGKLLAPTEAPQPGDVLVFDRATQEAPADLIAIAIGRDTRGVTELIYAGGGVVRRGFVDPAHPSARRDLGGNVLNTFLRHGKQWPPKGTRYLTGELLAHVIRTR